MNSALLNPQDLVLELKNLVSKMEEIKADIDLYDNIVNKQLEKDEN